MKNNTLLLVFILLTCSVTASDLVVIHGNTHFDTEELQQQLTLPDEFDSIKRSRQKFFMLLAKTNLEFLYKNVGYFNAKLSIKDSLDDTPQINNLHVITITEGEQFRYSDITLNISDTAKLLVQYSDFEVYALKKFNQKDISSDITFLTQRYRENGFLHVSVQNHILVDTLENSLQLIYKVNPGSQVKFGTIKVACKRSKSYREKNSSDIGLTSPEFISSMWEKQQGEIIDNNYFDDFRAKLLSTRLFSQVILRDSLDQSGSNNFSTINVKTVEKVPGSARLRLFYEQIYGLGISGELKHKNLGGHFHEAWISGTLAQNKKRAAIGYANPLLFNTPIRFENELSILKDSLVYRNSKTLLRKNYVIENKGKISQNITDNIRIIGEIRLRDVIEYHREERTYTGLIEYHRGDGSTDSTYHDTTSTSYYDDLKIKFKAGVSFDFTDNPISPENGFKNILSVGNGGPFNTKDRYTYGLIESKAYKRLNQYFQLASAVDYGHFFNGTTDEVDYSTFNQGGSRTVRGYSLGEITPNYIDEIITLDEINSIDHRPAFIRASFELRITPPFKVLADMQIVPYYDWANVWDMGSLRNKAGSGTALGLGLRYKVQILTIRVDYTFKKYLNRPFDFSDENYKDEGQRLVIDLMQAI